MDEQKLHPVTPRTTAIPSDRAWFDPRLLTGATYPQTTDIALPAGVSTPIVTPNPRRWGLFLGRTNPSPVNLYVAPWSDPEVTYFWTQSLTSDPFWTLFNFGTIVCNGWWANSASPAVMRVIELIRQ